MDHDEAAFETVAEIPVDPSEAVVYELGWQTCSPSVSYRITDPPHRPTSLRNQLIGFRPGRPIPVGTFQGEGLLALQAAAGEPVDVFAIGDARTSVPSIRARLDGRRVVVSADGPVEHHRRAAGEATGADTTGSGRTSGDVGAAIEAALADWAEGLAARMGVGEVRPAPTIWCSWYRYFDAVTEADVVENVEAIERLRLPVDVVQLDDGWQRCVGDWQSTERFGSLAAVVHRAVAAGRRAGIWLAPFLVRAASEVARHHPDWLVSDDSGPVWLGRNWGDDLYALDSTNEAAWSAVLASLRSLRELGFDFFKLDFLYAGAIDGHRQEQTDPVVAYRAALASIREAIGPDAYVLGAGPLLPSVGLVDAMRIAPDIALAADPDDGDMSQPSVSTAMMTSRGRAFAHGRLFANDSDCLIARPDFEARSRWLEHLERWGGMRGSSDRLAELDRWGLDATRDWLASPVPATLVPR